MEPLTARFRAILAHLRAAIWRQVGGEPARVAIFALLYNRIGRMAARFETLFTRWQAGTLPPPRPARIRPQRPDRPRPVSPAMPRRRGWLLCPPEHFRMDVALVHGRLQHLLGDPQMVEFLAAVPQAGRILRPLCHMLGNDVPPPLRLPPRPRPAAPPRPRPPHPPAADARDHPIYPVGFRPYPFLKTA